MAKSVKLGRIRFFLWSGSWSKPASVACDTCRWNYYVGPFGIEVADA